MTIPAGAAQVNWLFGGAALPNGAQVTCGLSGIGVATPETIADDMIAVWDASFAHIQCETISLVGVLVKIGPDATGPSIQVGGPGGLYVASPPVPANTALLVQKRTASGGRRGRGRFYIPGIPEGSVAGDGRVEASFLLDCQDKADDFMDQMATAAYVPVLLHDGPGAPTAITSLQCQSLVATQRRRLRP